MAKLILGTFDFLKEIEQTGSPQEFSDSQIEQMKTYYKKTEKENSMQVNSILTSGRELASKIFIAN